MDDKQTLRRDFLLERKHLDRTDAERRSFQVRHHVQGLIRNGDRVLMFYVPINNEVDLLPLAANLCETNRTVLFPRLSGGQIVPCQVKDFYREFRPGAFNIPEPSGVPYRGAIDKVFVPGVVFGRDGSRIGYGRGYYDAFLKTARASDKIGVAYDFQLVDSVPRTERDVVLDRIVSEEGVTGPGRK